MTTEPVGPRRLIWATRGYAWGFRFLLDAGLTDPLPEYERAFDGLDDAPSTWRRGGDQVALRFTDPLSRRDSAGRVIPHEFVIFGRLAEVVTSVEDGLRDIWPLVADAYAATWDSDVPPTRVDISEL